MPPKRGKANTATTSAPTRTTRSRSIASKKVDQTAAKQHVGDAADDDDDDAGPPEPDSKKRKKSKTASDPSTRPQAKAKIHKPAAPSSAAKKTNSVKPAEATERDESQRCYWLMKAEPESRLEKGHDVKFSIDDLRERTEPEPWDGVRNAVAQKNMKNMRKGEFAFFYHSNCKVPGIAGVMKIVQEQSTDQSAFDPDHPYYDPKSKADSPRWIVVHVEFVKKFDELIPLKKLQGHAQSGEPLESLQTLKLSRLSVSQVKPDEWAYILGLANVEQSEIEELAQKPFEQRVSG